MRLGLLGILRPDVVRRGLFGRSDAFGSRESPRSVPRAPRRHPEASSPAPPRVPAGRPDRRRCRDTTLPPADRSPTDRSARREPAGRASEARPVRRRHPRRCPIPRTGPAAAPRRPRPAPQTPRSEPPGTGSASAGRTAPRRAAPPACATDGRWPAGPRQCRSGRPGALPRRSAGCRRGPALRARGWRARNGGRSPPRRARRPGASRTSG